MQMTPSTLINPLEVFSRPFQQVADLEVKPWLTYRVTPFASSCTILGKRSQRTTGEEPDTKKKRKVEATDEVNINSLPPELHVKIFKYLNPIEQHHAKDTCKKFNNIVTTLIWPLQLAKAKACVDTLLDSGNCDVLHQWSGEKRYETLWYLYHANQTKAATKKSELYFDIIKKLAAPGTPDESAALAMLIQIIENDTSHLNKMETALHCLAQFSKANVQFKKHPEKYKKLLPALTSITLSRTWAIGNLAISLEKKAHTILSPPFDKLDEKILSFLNKIRNLPCDQYRDYNEIKNLIHICSFLTHNIQNEGSRHEIIRKLITEDNVFTQSDLFFISILGPLAHIDVLDEPDNLLLNSLLRMIEPEILPPHYNLKQKFPTNPYPHYCIYVFTDSMAELVGKIQKINTCAAERIRDVYFRFLSMYLKSPKRNSSTDNYIHYFFPCFKLPIQSEASKSALQTLYEHYCNSPSTETLTPLYRDPGYIGLFLLRALIPMKNLGHDVNQGICKYCTSLKNYDFNGDFTTYLSSLKPVMLKLSSDQDLEEETRGSIINSLTAIDAQI